MILMEMAGPMRRHLDLRREEGARIGFVPTMGALHEGHLALIRRSKSETDLTVCSIFVNPAQFNDPADLLNYPRTPQRDKELLESVATDLLFLPPVEEIYPPGQEAAPPVDLGLLDRVMEGKFRPGHFAGVAKVVYRLLDLVRPDRLYMGRKDYQQLAVIGRMIGQFGLPVTLVPCPTVREADGLALSSRNQRLTPEFRRLAPAIYRTLQLVRDRLLRRELSPEEGEKLGLRELTAAGLRPEYFEVADGRTLAPVKDLRDAASIVICAAAWAGDVRLIDNLTLTGGQ